MNFNKNGVLINPDFHDGNLTGMRVVGEALQLFLTTTDQRKFIVTIPNIVFDVSLYQNAECSEEKLKSLYGYNKEQAQKYLPKNLIEIADKKLTLFELGSSYGCELLALFSGSIQIESESES